MLSRAYVLLDDGPCFCNPHLEQTRSTISSVQVSVAQGTTWRRRRLDFCYRIRAQCHGRCVRCSLSKQSRHGIFSPVHPVVSWPPNTARASCRTPRKICGYPGGLTCWERRRSVYWPKQEGRAASNSSCQHILLCWSPTLLS